MNAHIDKYQQMTVYCREVNSAALRTGALVQKGSQCKKQKLQLKIKGMLWSAEHYYMWGS